MLRFTEKGKSEEKVTMQNGTYQVDSKWVYLSFNVLGRGGRHLHLNGYSSQLKANM